MQNILKQIQENNARNTKALEQMEQANPTNPEYTFTLSRKDIDILFDIGGVASNDRIYREYELFDIYSKMHRQIMDSLLDKIKKIA